MKNIFIKGMKDGIPIGLGYFAVSFSIGIVASNIGLNVIQGALISALNNASAGEYAGLNIISNDSGFMQMVLISIIVNARYFLMSCALSQKLSPSMPFIHRFIIGFDITDELFGLAINQKGYMDPYYYYGAMSTSFPGWTIGTVLGVLVGSIIPDWLMSGFSVMLFGMFIAIVIPAGKEDHVVLGCIFISFILSFIFNKVFVQLSSGAIIIILTVLISAIAAYFFPREDV